jgi:hypothetical protein
MMIRCGSAHDATNFITMFVVAEPFSPRAQPRVTLRGSRQDITLKADVIPPGASISVPLDIRAQMAGAWNGVADLSVVISDESNVLHGLVHLTGLSGGLLELAPACNAVKRR